MKVAVLLPLMAVLVSGCLPKGAFAPPPDAYEHWAKPGADEVSIWKRMLECNFAEPFGGGRGIQGGERTFDETAASMICMERSGYSYIHEGNIRQVCSISEWKQSGACGAGAAVPIPDVSRRLGSGYCRKYAQSRACVP